jgi:hypothetical protein
MGLARMPDNTTVQDWIKIHRELLQQEAAFTDIALKAAAGEITVAELDEQRQILMALRELCAVTYERAFGRPARP